jgi:diadenylate cyclase
MILELIWLIKIGFLPIRLWDVLDIVIVGFLIYQIYKLLRGSIAFNIFTGVIIMYVIWWLVGVLKMDLLALLLKQFVSVGVIVLIIIFQPEVRRFLLLLGNTTIRQRSNFFNRMLDRNMDTSIYRTNSIKEIKEAMIRMSKKKWGALIVLARNLEMQGISSSGVEMEATISQALLESIFNKEGPLHDGAVLIANNLIHAASCILPVSDNPSLPQSVGLRHRAAVGITERMKVACLIVSEETGSISFAYGGELRRHLTEGEVESLLQEHL